MSDRIVAVALLTRPELQALGSAFNRAWPVMETPGLNGLLDAIDEADRRLQGSINVEEGSGTSSEHTYGTTESISVDAPGRSARPHPKA